MSEAEYVLYYWPSIPGRGEFVKFVLEEAGASYRDVGRERGSEAIMEARRGWARSFAPPVIEHGEGHVRLSQTPIICSWLGERHGLAPEGEAERLQARALQATIADVVAEVHALHHPIATALYYDDQKVEATRAAGHFRDGRLAEWLEFFEGAIKGPWVFGEGISHVDLCPVRAGARASLRDAARDDAAPGWVPRLGARGRGRGESRADRDLSGLRSRGGAQ